VKRFEDRIILVTGGAGGQGAEEARRLVAEGARVVIGDVLEDQGRALAASLHERAIFLRLDVADPASWDSAIAACERLGGLHGLVNNAGIYQPRPIAETDVALIERHFGVNQLGALLGMKHSAPLLAKSGGGAIVNVSSTAGLQGIPNAAAYVGTKWALRGMTKTAALEFAPLNIRVNSVHPGLIDTTMLASRARDDLERRAAKIPLRRMGTAGDVATVVLFLLSDDSGYMTGAELSVDGGLSL
jgi:3alpha(or 20beta)-hydroxysteroid dehydrogenase